MSSRLIIKNLPKYLTDERLRTHFSQKGNVTDCKIMKTKDGKSRLFGFVGYQSEQEAREAAQFFNKSFIDTTRISVEVAKPYGDDSLPRPWSKYSTGTSANKKVQEEKHKKLEEKKEKLKKQLQIETVDDLAEKDPKLKEFLQVMKPRTQKKTWENDDIIGDQEIKEREEASNEKMFSLGDFMKSKKPQKVIEEQKETQKDSDLIMDSGRLFVRNLAFHCTETDLENLFSPFGAISEVHLPISKETKMPKGFAYLTFMFPEHALKAYTALDGTIFQGRILHILPGKEKPSDHEEKEEQIGLYKLKKRKDLKENSRSEHNWNSLFMSQDAVAEAMARQMDVQKRELLDPESDQAAVRLALAETHIIQETIEYLKQEGVDLDAFKMYDKKERSKTIIMVKNIPYNTTETELRKLFVPFGDVLRVVLPPTKTLALIEYSAANEAKTGFTALAYKNFKGKPIFLEMAPVNALKERASTEPKVPVTSVDIMEEDPAEDEVEMPTLYVKNISFQTTQDDFKFHFSQLPGFRSSKIVQKKNPKSGEMLSTGFGFVEFDSKESAKEALTKLQHSVLDGHTLQLKFSNQLLSTPAPVKTSQKKTTKLPKELGTKLIIRNVPFEATKKDLQSLFSTFGQLKRIRLPKKVNGNTHRGFAFIEFLTKQEAKKAFENLFHTHLYGRHLVLEYADADSVALA